LAAPVTSGFPSGDALCGRWIDREWKPQPDGLVEGFGGFDRAERFIELVLERPKRRV
jgi:hypothetical protein